LALAVEMSFLEMSSLMSLMEPSLASMMRASPQMSMSFEEEHNSPRFTLWWMRAVVA